MYYIFCRQCQSANFKTLPNRTYHQYTPCGQIILLFLGVVRLAPNVALRGTATQSSDNEEYLGQYSVASQAIDGNFGSRCSRTNPYAPVWWQVDLLEVYLITKVAINSGNTRYGMCCLDLDFFLNFSVINAISISSFSFVLNSKEHLH